MTKRGKKKKTKPKFKPRPHYLGNYASDVVRNKMEDICVAFQRVCETFQIVDWNSFQREAMGYFVKKKEDVFVNLHRLGTAVNKSLGQRIIILQVL